MASTERESIIGRGPVETSGMKSPDAEMPFVYFHTKAGPKVNNFSDSSSLCARQTASHSHD